MNWKKECKDLLHSKGYKVYSTEGRGCDYKVIHFVKNSFTESVSGDNYKEIYFKLKLKID